MKTRRSGYLFAATAVLGSSLAVLPLTAPQASAADTTKQLLVQLGLQETKCTPGVVVLWIGNKPACAIANGKYAAGTYRLNPNDYSIVPVGTSAQVGGAQNDPKPQSGGINNTIVLTPAMGGAGAVYPYPMPIAPFPTVISSLNPGVPVSPEVVAKINAAFSTQGLQPAACSATPVAVFSVGGYYTACAFPTANFPGGNYRLNIPGLY